MRHAKPVSVSLVAGLSFWLSTVVFAAPQVGWWWNPSESGRGFFVESQNGVTFIAAYLYDDDGHATWFVAGGPNADAYNYSGPLYNLSNGQTLFGGYVKPGNLTVAGQMSVHFSDDTHGTFSWPGGVVPIQREIFGSGEAPFQAYSGWWWNSSESGSGYSLELQGNNLFVVGFMYDDGGRPTWYFTAGPMSSPTTYHGDVLQYAGGQTMGGPYHPPSGATKVGTVDIDFATLDSATITFNGTSAASELLRKSSRTDEITREFKDAFAFPTFYVGPLTVDVVASGSESIASLSAHHTLTGKNLTWQLSALDAPPFVEGLHTATYILVGGQFTLDISDQDQVPTPDGTVTCTTTATGNALVSYAFLASSSLVVDSRGHYDLNFDLDQSGIDTSGKLVCVGIGGGAVDPVDVPVQEIPLNQHGLSGSVTDVLEDITDNIPETSGPFAGGSYTITGNYAFYPYSECPDGNPVCLTGSERAAGRIAQSARHVRLRPASFEGATLRVPAAR